MALRMRVHDREPIGLALRRFKRLLERSGISREMKMRSRFIPASELRWRKKIRKLLRAREATRRDKRQGLQ
jgi:small subunit ribosomal protein S21